MLCSSLIVRERIRKVDGKYFFKLQNVTRLIQLLGTLQKYFLHNTCSVYGGNDVSRYHR